MSQKEIRENIKIYENKLNEAINQSDNYFICHYEIAISFYKNLLK